MSKIVFDKKKTLGDSLEEYISYLNMRIIHSVDALDAVSGKVDAFVAHAAKNRHTHDASQLNALEQVQEKLKESPFYDGKGHDNAAMAIDHLFITHQKVNKEFSTEGKGFFDSLTERLYMTNAYVRVIKGLKEISQPEFVPGKDSSSSYWEEFNKK